MRLLFTTPAARPHLYLMVPLAWACRAAGHEVRIASSPALADDIVRTGLPAVGVGRDPEPTAASTAAKVRYYRQGRWPADWPLDLGLLSPAQRAVLEDDGRYLTIPAEAMVDDLVAFAQEWRPDLVVYDFVSLAGAVAAGVLGVPSVRHLPGISQRPEMSGLGPEPLAEHVHLFGRFGLEPLPPPTVSVDPSPPSLRLPSDGWPCLLQRHVPYNGPGVVPRWLPPPARGRPRVCLTWGVTLVRHLGGAAGSPFREVVDAICDLDVEMIVVSSAEQLASLGELPGNARAAVSVPLHLLLPSCDAMVHQGGEGGTLTAATLSVPQLTITRGPEQTFTGGRIAATGAGIHLVHEELGEQPGRRDVICGAIDKLLGDPDHREAAGRLRDEIAGLPAPAALVPALEALTESR